MYMYSCRPPPPSSLPPMSVDDQLDEDDLELIKENIGVDIQVVSTHMYMCLSTYACTCSQLSIFNSILYRRSHVELGLRVMMKRRRRVRGGGRVGGEGVRVEDVEIRDLPSGTRSWIR